MIKAKKNKFLDSLLYLYFRNMGQGAFHTIAVRGLHHLHSLPSDRPVILFSSHTNWWDGLMVFLLTRQMRHKSVYCVMEEKQLQQYRFFSWLGAFSVDLSNKLKMTASLRYALQLLERSDTALWIFPQGKICPPNDPIRVKPGTNYLAKKAIRAMLVPVAMRYEFFREDRPNALIEIGSAFPAQESSDELIMQRCQQQMSALSVACADQDLTGFEQLFSPRWPVNKKWLWFKLAVQGRLAEFDPEN